MFGSCFPVPCRGAGVGGVLYKIPYGKCLMLQMTGGHVTIFSSISRIPSSNKTTKSFTEVVLEQREEA